MEILHNCITESGNADLFKVVFPLWLSKGTEDKDGGIQEFQTSMKELLVGTKEICTACENRPDTAWHYVETERIKVGEIRRKTAQLENMCTTVNTILHYPIMVQKLMPKLILPSQAVCKVADSFFAPQGNETVQLAIIQELQLKIVPLTLPPEVALKITDFLLGTGRSQM
jgi:hypothetical protein